MSIQDSIVKGVQWLASVQDSNSSWNGTSYVRIAITGLAILKLESYALEIGLSPFDDACIYKNTVINGLNYIFLNAK